MKGIYLAAFRAEHKGHNIVYQDINGKRDIDGDMMLVDLNGYDYIIATPPCNYYSICNYRRNESEYSLKTKHLLPGILEKLGKQEKPFIVENVKNYPIMNQEGVWDICDKLGIFSQVVGRHTYFTNQLIDLKCEQHFDFNKGGYLINNDGHREGGENVHKVIEYWIRSVENGV